MVLAVGEILDIVPSLHHRGDVQGLERCVNIAKQMFAASPRQFIRAYFSTIRELSVDGTLQIYGNIDPFICPVRLFFISYSVRVLQKRLPFTAVIVDENMVSSVERILYDLRLNSYYDEIQRAHGSIGLHYLHDVLKMLYQD